MPEILSTLLIAGTGALVFRLLLDDAGGPGILRSPRAWLPLAIGIVGLLAAFGCALAIAGVRNGSLTGLSIRALQYGMIAGSFVAAGGFAAALLPNIRRQKRLEQMRRSLGRLVDPAAPVMLLGPGAELRDLGEQLVRYRALLAGSPLPADHDPARLAMIDERIEQIARALRVDPRAAAR